MFAQCRAEQITRCRTTASSRVLASWSRAKRQGIAAILLLLAWQASTVGELRAQTEADRESVRAVVEGLFDLAEEYGDSIPHHSSAWSVVIGRFAKGDTKQIEIPMVAGERYQIWGQSESRDTDVDICVFNPQGQRVDCDTEEDNVPLIWLLEATVDGVYRVVMTAASVDGGTSFAGMVVLKR